MSIPSETEYICVKCGATVDFNEFKCPNGHDLKEGGKRKIDHVQDVPSDKADEFIRKSEKTFPKLKYIKRKSKSGKEGCVGIYNYVREQVI